MIFLLSSGVIFAHSFRSTRNVGMMLWVTPWSLHHSFLGLGGNQGLLGYSGSLNCGHKNLADAELFAWVPLAWDWGLLSGVWYRRPC